MRAYLNTSRHGNKTVVCDIIPDDEMPYLTTASYTDEYGVVHPMGVIERADAITNSLGIVNRTIGMALFEPSVTFILDRTRKHMDTLKTIDEQKDFMFRILSIFNPDHAHDLDVYYDTLSPKGKRKFIDESISLNKDGTLKTNNGMYTKWVPFNDKLKLRDSIIEIYDKFDDVIKPYNIFVPKPNWGRDIYIGQGCIGYQYILLLKQSGEKGFSVRSTGAISDESLPERSHENKIGKLWHSETPISLFI